MASNRPSVKTWTHSSDADLLAKHDDLVKLLQDPAYASIDPSTVASGAPMHTVSRGTLSALEQELDKRGVTYTPSQGRILPMPGTPSPNPRSATKTIDDIVEALGDAETGKTFRDLIEKSNFLEREFNFPGAKKSVTGQEILQHINGVEVKEGIGSIAAYDLTSRKIHFDPTLTKQLRPMLEQSGLSPEAAAKYLQEQFSFTTIHELGHVGADLTGIDSVGKRTGQTLGKQMPESVAKHIGEQEKIADSFAQETFKSVGKDPSQYSYLTAAESVTHQQEAVLGRKLTVDESLQLEDALRQNNIDPKSRVQLASYLEGDIQSEKLKVISDAYTHGEGVELKSANLTAPATATTSASTTTTKPIGRPVETAATKDRPRVIFQSGKEAGSATAKKPEQIIGQVIDDTAKRLSQEAKVVGRETAHAGEKISAGLRKTSQDISRALLDGTKGTRNIKLLGAAALIGAGGYMMSKKTHRSNVDYDRQLEMQRRRNIM